MSWNENDYVVDKSGWTSGVARNINSEIEKAFNRENVKLDLEDVTIKITLPLYNHLVVNGFSVWLENHDTEIIREPCEELGVYSAIITSDKLESRRILNGYNLH